MSEFINAIDLYCERTGQGAFDEPFNVLSNASFVIAALWAGCSIPQGQRRSMAMVLCVLAAFIGLGSFAFHSHPNIVTQWIDVVPIWGFVGCYAVAAIHLATAGNWVRTIIASFVGALLLMVLFIVGGEMLTATPPGAETRPMNGSIQYTPVVITLLFFSACATLVRHQSRYHLWAATLMFCVALGFRTIDIDVCRTFPVGTHFLWHLLNGWVVWVLLRAYIQCGFQKR